MRDAAGSFLSKRKSCTILVQSDPRGCPRRTIPRPDPYSVSPDFRLTLDCSPEFILRVMAPTKGYRIGEIASLTGLTPDALRFYERRGLLEAPARSQGRFRILRSHGS